MIPAHVLRVRTRNCGDCGCPADKADPCAACPARKWGPFNCLEAQFPALAEQAASFWASVKAEAAAVVTGQAPPDTERRMAVCESCEFFRGGRCLKCGCFLKWKTAWRSQKCPVGKW